MKAEFRLLRFVPDPFYPGGFHVAAVMRTNGQVELVLPRQLPDARCLGGEQRAHLLELGIRDMTSSQLFNTLPASLGPHFALSSQTYKVPSTVPDPVVWIKNNLWGEHVTDKRPQRFVNRGTEGLAFLRTLGIGSHVHKNFSPSHSVPGLLMEFEDSLERITHYVLGARSPKILLMEPLIVSRRDWNDDAKKINTRFAAYRQACLRQNEWECEFLSYMVPGNAQKARLAAAKQLGAFSDHVIDCDAPSHRDFLKRTVIELSSPLSMVDA